MNKLNYWQCHTYPPEEYPRCSLVEAFRGSSLDPSAADTPCATLHPLPRTDATGKPGDVSAEGRGGKQRGVRDGGGRRAEGTEGGEGREGEQRGGEGKGREGGEGEGGEGKGASSSTYIKVKRKEEQWELALHAHTQPGSNPQNLLLSNLAMSYSHAHSFTCAQKGFQEARGCTRP